MVFLSLLRFGAPKGLSTRTRFIDRLRVHLRAGLGGQGFPKHGGLGGDGGNIVFEAEEGSNLYNFLQLNPKKRFKAQDGENSKRMMLMGGNGEPTTIKVPTGVCFTRDDGTLVGELNVPGEALTVAHGGQGGGPMNDYLAGKGDSYSLRIDLKLLADVGLVGFPNAGKSTFLTAISRAHPKIADYPFTTLRPHLGVVKFEDSRMLTFADLPGLIEGAHMNIGMGHFFLKHVERTKLLLVLVDINGFVLKVDSPYRTALETVLLLNKELEMYKSELLDKPQVLLINKMDTDGAQEKYAELETQLHNLGDHVEILPTEYQPQRLFNFKHIEAISAATGELQPCLDKIREVIDELALENPADERLSEFNKTKNKQDKFTEIV